MKDSMREILMNGIEVKGSLVIVIVSFEIDT